MNSSAKHSATVGGSSPPELLPPPVVVEVDVLVESSVVLPVVSDVPLALALSRSGGEPSSAHAVATSNKKAIDPGPLPSKFIRSTIAATGPGWS
jgi:hypothetical protein